MPPRLPHRLTKPPTNMDKPELAVFAALGVSVAVGLMQMGSNIMQVYRGGKVEGDEIDSGESAACPMNWGKTESGALRKQKE
mmetsp:Transcript_4378/g.9450  ORF Transcript_4378/g.9450 Transcript_4378/m.9450 type:complete len:82 (-) Transcript_4378:92-337(-)